MNVYGGQIHDHGKGPLPSDVNDEFRKGEAAALHAYRNQRYGHIQPHSEASEAVVSGQYNPKDLTSFHNDANSAIRKQRAVQQMNSNLDPHYSSYLGVVHKDRAAEANAWKEKARIHLKRGNLMHRTILNMLNNGSSSGCIDEKLKELHECNLHYADSKLRIERCNAEAESLSAS